VNIDRAIEKVLQALDERWGVEALWVFGSQARGTATSHSDLDVAALFRARPSEAELLSERSWLESAAGVAVDVIDLDAASPIVAMQVLKHGRLVLDRKPARRIHFAAHLPGRYEDLVRIRRPIERAVTARLTHGRA
jgi:uncharacterized protein